MKLWKKLKHKGQLKKNLPINLQLNKWYNSRNKALQENNSKILFSIKKIFNQSKSSKSKVKLLNLKGIEDKNRNNLKLMIDR